MVESRNLDYRLAVYNVLDDGLYLVITLDLKDFSGPLCVDPHNRQIYIPAGLSGGVSVVSWDGGKLLLQGTLNCVSYCYQLAVVCPHTLCVGDTKTEVFSVVNVKEDRITATINKPQCVRDNRPEKIAVLGDSILASYKKYDGVSTLVLYENGVSSPGTRIPSPDGLQTLSAISADIALSRFLLLDGTRHVVYILDVEGELCHTVDIDTDDYVSACTVGDGPQLGKLFMACSRPDRIIVMSP